MTEWSADLISLVDVLPTVLNLEIKASQYLQVGRQISFICTKLNHDNNIISFDTEMEIYFVFNNKIKVVN